MIRVKSISKFDIRLNLLTPSLSFSSSFISFESVHLVWFQFSLRFLHLSRCCCYLFRLIGIGLFSFASIFFSNWMHFEFQWMIILYVVAIGHIKEKLRKLNQVSVCAVIWSGKTKTKWCSGDNINTHASSLYGKVILSFQRAKTREKKIWTKMKINVKSVNR